MKLYRRSPKQVVHEPPQQVVATVPHVQAVPIAVAVQKGGPAQQVKVDLACVIGSKIVIAGWSTAEVELFVQAGDVALRAERIGVKRPDVAAHLSIPNEETGFILTAPHVAEEPVTLSWTCPVRNEKQSFVLETVAEPSPGTVECGMIAPAFPALLRDGAAFTDEWKKLIALLPRPTTHTNDAKAYIELAKACERTGEGVIVGWLLQKNPAAAVWVEDEDGNVLKLRGSYRSYRQDVVDAFGYQFGTTESAGIIAHVRGMRPGKKVQLKTLVDGGVHVIAEALCNLLPSDPVAAARRLFSLNVVPGEFHNRVAAIDEPIIGKLLRLRRVAQENLPVKQRHFGTPLEAPLVSIIVPLYGRVDFIDHQLMEFYDDEWLKQNAELIYVVDDPALMEHFATKIEAWYRVYRLPIRWVWGGANRGFSGANNLGVSCSKGEYLTFLNSDAFPQGSGWLKSLVEVLVANPNVGAVGPRLVTAEGSIQHAGMEFLRREDLGIWVNHHPYMGLDPSLDPAKELTVVPSVTGACLVMRRSDFDTVGGWDTGYLIGDFEDSDLCLKLRDAGFDIAYCPSVQLTHLERQSFKLLGNDEFRTRVVVYNAVRHQNRWGSFLESGNRVSST
jgi:GT2 family glycosyltransferase